MPNLKQTESITILCSLDLDPKSRKDIIKNLSGAVLSHQGKFLWLGTDEFTSIERLTKIADAENTFADHKRFHLKDFIADFEEEQGEIDIEGLDYHGNYLWLIGSHSSKRKKAKINPDKFKLEKNELKKIERQENRYLLARIPVNESGELEAESTAWLPRNGSSNSLMQALANDEYLDLATIIKSKDGGSSPGKEVYFYLPSKENGLDIEGLAVCHNQILIGLRGPVLRGIAILLEIEVEASLPPELSLKAIGNQERLYKRHFLDLNGLGIRELCWEDDGESLLILAGPTMDLDGALQLFRLKQPLALEDDSLSSTQNQQLEYLGDIPHGFKSDRAEGLALYGSEAILVVYDSPNQARIILDDNHDIVGVQTDVYSTSSDRD
ncbi:MAG: DUF3616 domain-containing protein [Aphanocapsa sp. GSE-SYN-MK-11-07L]|jgi:hypothetical protein|nr:DUF3616 domain-containing protein [Aphanocapsa sp. GSE-SYN-MK-11-07L]